MKFIDLSNKVEAFIVEALESILKIAEVLDIPFFVVGATARDVILVHAFGIKPTRATKDVDIGVQVGNNSTYYPKSYWVVSSLLKVKVLNDSIIRVNCESILYHLVTLINLITRFHGHQNMSLK
jgi:hypothetical protein